jgi:predicted P-loop ATPase
MAIAVAADNSGGGKVLGMWADRLDRTEKGKPIDCWQNVVRILTGHPEWIDTLGADTFAKRIELRSLTPLGHKPGDIWGAMDNMALGMWLASQCGLLVKRPDTIDQAVGYVASRKPFHPVQEYLDDLEWDGKCRVIDWVPRLLGAPTTMYHMLVGQFFMVALVQRVYEPGCQMRAVPVLEGPQNVGKSSAVRALAEPWFADTPFHVGHKDSYQQLHGQLVYEISELESFTRAEAAQVKAFIASREDYFRAPYDRAPQKHLRQTVFMATTNASQYLKDWSGNTRFWPIKCGTRVDFDALADERDQLFAEALVHYNAGEPSFPTREDQKKWFADQQEERVQGHPWEDLIATWLNENTFPSTTVATVLMDACKVDPGRMNLNGQDAQRVGQIMSRIGWARRRTSKPGRPWEYLRPAPEPKPAREPGSDDDVPL